MKFTSLFAVAALVANTSAMKSRSPLLLKPSSLHQPLDHMPLIPITSPTSAMEDMKMRSCTTFSRDSELRRKTHSAPVWASSSSQNGRPQWSRDIISHMHVMDEDKVDAYVAANFDNFWKKYDNNGTGEIYESESETFMRALLGPNNRFRLAPGALSDMDNAEMIVQNQFSKEKAIVPFKHRYELV